MPRPLPEVPWLERRNGVYNAVWYEKPTEAERRKNPKAKNRKKRFGLRTRDASEAQARFAAFLSTGQELLSGSVGNSQLTVSQALDDYYREHVAENVTDKARQEDAIRHLKDFFGNTLLQWVDIPQCRGYTEARRSGAIGGGARVHGDRKRGSNGTIRRELHVLKAAANHALRWKRIDLSKMPTFEMPSEHRETNERPWFTKAEIDVLLRRAAADAEMAIMLDEPGALMKCRLRDFIVLGYGWGARRHSIETLEVSQVSLGADRVNLHKAGQRITKKRKPIVPIYEELRPTLERLVRDAQGGWLFGGPTIDLYRPFRALCRTCGLGHKAWPHVLRHSRATHLLMEGHSIYKVARLLGDTVATVERVYGHCSPEYLAEKSNA